MRCTTVTMTQSTAIARTILYCNFCLRNNSYFSRTILYCNILRFLSSKQHKIRFRNFKTHKLKTQKTIKMATINTPQTTSTLLCTSPNNKMYECTSSSSNMMYGSCSNGGLPYISPFRFYTQSSTRFSNDGTFDVKYDVVFSSSVTSHAA